MEKQLHGAALSISQLINPFNQVTHEPLPAGHTNIKDPDLFPEVKALGLRPVLLVPVESEGPQIVKFGRWDSLSFAGTNSAKLAFPPQTDALLDFPQVRKRLQQPGSRDNRLRCIL